MKDKLINKVSENINADYKIGGKKVSIKTTNLNDDWENIEERLLSII